MPPVLNTPYCNTIPLANQPQYPGNLDIETRIIGLVRWNALAMVVHANKIAAELGGHIATYASIADMFEVGFNHFFRAGQQAIWCISNRTPPRECMRAPISKADSPRSNCSITARRPAARACPPTAIRG